MRTMCGASSPFTPMLKNLQDRLLHALLGFIFGAVLGATGWWLYDGGMSTRQYGAQIHLGVAQWIEYAGGGFALVGFLFKERAGSAVAGAAAGMYEAQRGAGLPDVPRWLAIPVLLAVLAGVWYYVRHHG